MKDSRRSRGIAGLPGAPENILDLVDFFNNGGIMQGEQLNHQESPRKIRGAVPQL